MNSEPKNVTPVKLVKAMPTSPISAQFDIIKVGDKDTVVGAIGFIDQFGMERMAKTVGETGVLNLGKHILAILAGQIDITEPSEADKARLAAQLKEKVDETKEAVLNAYAENTVNVEVVK